MLAGQTVCSSDHEEEAGEGVEKTLPGREAGVRKKKKLDTNM